MLNINCNMRYIRMMTDWLVAISVQKWDQVTICDHCPHLPPLPLSLYIIIFCYVFLSSSNEMMSFLDQNLYSTQFDHILSWNGSNENLYSALFNVAAISLPHLCVCVWISLNSLTHWPVIMYDFDRWHRFWFIRFFSEVMNILNAAIRCIKFSAPSFQVIAFSSSIWWPLRYILQMSIHC